jgi:glycosyltransferase involved in cell wall biosynthesis
MTDPGLPSVSAIIATRGRPTLGRAIEGVLGQRYDGQVTCIVVFDGVDPIDLSETPTGERRSLVAISNRRTPGLAGARNTGVDAATTELLAFCDDDDVWWPEKLRAQVERMRRDASSVSVTGVRIVADERETDRIPPPVVTQALLLRSRVTEVHPSSVVVDRAAFHDIIGPIDEAIPGSYGEDYDWILRAAQAGDLAVVEEALVRVRWGQSLFSQRWQMIHDALGYLVDKHPAFRRDPRALARITGQQAFALAALGRRREAARAAVRTIRSSPRERRAYLALAVASGVVSAPRVLDLAHRHGRGI